ncbi:gfo/Idh/MocA family oxidoreductase [Streptomyces sp. 3MP-14]|uniref:Gfo/Idh/MocA family oxidoreductase n=1 Tax=Streptomyces mimosae TaxID=2586635 RepID=A0A5N6AGZ4_9ACTN|nr:MULTISPECIES: Gfo/Idh/MocA family oxidoreductase [Streptomyces]KAB8167276.1 gfo/Idh/MocA family oxidoreductase [Streptomyces mimosae]KAB8177216.1 gfo/Idh/MocA family oxidoreductase [Streptomyces sp. 3MP-14]
MRVGVVGLGMGLRLADGCRRLGIEVAAVCDRDPARLAAALAQLPGATGTDDWTALLDAGLDGVVLANDFDAHAPLATAFLARDIAVLSETAACVDEAEGRALIAAAESSRASYSFAENYVLLPQTRLLRAAVEAGELGRLQLVEADYLHGLSPAALAELTGDPRHWRGRIGPTAYCTHTLSPILALTGAWPVEVSAFPVDEGDRSTAVVLVVRLSTGALAVSRFCFLQGEPESHWSALSLRGTRALAESVRAPGERAWAVRFRREAWTTPDGAGAHEEERVPPPLVRDGAVVEREREATVLLLEGWRATVAEGRPPLVPVRPAVAASLVGVAGAVSLAEGSRPVPVPDVAPDNERTPPGR